MLPCAGFPIDYYPDVADRPVRPGRLRQCGDYSPNPLLVLEAFCPEIVRTIQLASPKALLNRAYA